MDHNYSMHDDTMRIVPLQYSEIEHLRVLRNNDAIRFSFINSDVISIEAQRIWFENYKTKEGDFMFTVYIDNIIIGFTGLYNHNGDTIEWGRIMIEPQHQKKGYAKHIWKLIKKIAICELNVRYIILEVLNSNEIALSLYKTIGFEITSKANGISSMIYRI